MRFPDSVCAIGPGHATRLDLARYFRLLTRAGAPSPRAVPPVLAYLTIERRGRNVRWDRIWAATGLEPEQDPALWDELRAPLLTTSDVAARRGVSEETLRRWRRERRRGMPTAIRTGEAQWRWRAAEVDAWCLGLPRRPYRRAAKAGGRTARVAERPALGALAPMPDTDLTPDTRRRGG